jgi:N6-L-threonylcarbamoyladenine synthase
MKILAIETSCDDTGIAILDTGESKNPFFSVLSNIVASQIEIHKKYGGVYPALAKREHQKNLVPTLIEALEKAKMLKEKNKKSPTPNIQNLTPILEREPELLKKLTPFLNKYEKPGIDIIAVTNGPGLEPCLWVGVNSAKALAFYWNIPTVIVNHVKAHIFVSTKELSQKDFPVLCLVVSGGHTQLFLMEDFGKYKILGETRDDAAGECFDKCAKILGLGYPGGPIISKLAEGIETHRTLPRPMIGTKDYEFSFSGLKTAVLYADRKMKNKNKEYKKHMAAEVQQAIIDVLIKKTIKAAKDYNAKTIIIGGGVAANKELRKQLSETTKKLLTNTNLLMPEPKYCTDNGLMVAITGYFKAKKNKFTKWQDIKADSNLRIE